MKILIVGPGNVGTELASQAQARGYITSFFGRKDDKREFRGRAAQSDVVCIAIPSKDKGEEEIFYTNISREEDKPVVTAAKCALAYRFAEILPHFPHMGISTVVGGASGMLHIIMIPSIGLQKIIGIVNGTINFLLSRTAVGVSWEKALEEAVEKKLTEGGSDLEEVFHGEIRDAVLKTACIANLARLFSESMTTPDEFNRSTLNREEILRLFEAKQCRLIVRIVRQEKVQTPSIPPVFHLWREGWSIVGEFAKPDPNEFPHGIPDDECNMLAVWNYAGRSEFYGIGAGARPTATTMLGEAEKLFANRRN